jgi:glutathione peroxidase
VLAFPCNQFGAQEPGTNEEIREFASSRYGASFPMFAKIEVNGDGAAELYRYLKGDGPDIAWNFTKFLVGRDGSVLARYEPQVTPEEIGEALAEHL